MDLVIINAKKQAVTTSRSLAKHFNKRHDNVIRKIGSLEKDVFNALKIEEVKYINEKREQQKEYRLNRDAFAFLAMGFTGKEADKFKLDFIRAFNEMEDFIKCRLQASAQQIAMNEILNQSLLFKGKQPKCHHFSNEARLINYALTGNFKAVKRDLLTFEDIDILNKILARDAVSIGVGLNYEERKSQLVVMVQSLNFLEAS